MYAVLAFTHDGQPFGAAKVTDKAEAERTAERYMAMTGIGRVEVRKLLPAGPLGLGNGRYR